MMSKILLQVCALALLSATTTRAFSVVTNTRSFGVVSSAYSRSPNNYQPLFMTDAASGEENASPEVEVEVETTEEEEVVVVAGADDDDADEVVAEEEEAEEKEPTEEEVEMVALKEEIATTEAALKEMRKAAALTDDRAEEFSAAGYARKVAEMEQMRRTRRTMQKTDSKGAAATILVDFLDVRDKLLALKETHGEDDFGKQYNALGSAMKSAFDNMGVVEYELAPGDAVDLRRMRVVEKEASEYVAADTVLRQSAAGLELEGNVVRKAEVVASSGPAVEAEEAVIVEDEAAAKEE